MEKVIENGRNIIKIPLKELVTTAMKERDKGTRLAQACASYVKGRYELIYSFADDYELVSYKVTVKPDEVVPSISSIYAPAFTYENEMKELFGVKIEGIVPDYNNKFYRIEQETPFLKKGGE
ncbi:MAG: NADH-quinone oxidoreductase subunit C [Lachnospiraceae bacterium]|nr:NADH-quinone oxidoreductase subunit C [Lachnospiraceae bacterium]